MEPGRVFGFGAILPLCSVGVDIAASTQKLRIKENSEQGAYKAADAHKTGSPASLLAGDWLHARKLVMTHA
eukprot:815386-Amphidinium_carterae.3